MDQLDNFGLEEIDLINMATNLIEAINQYKFLKRAQLAHELSEIRKYSINFKQLFTLLSIFLLLVVLVIAYLSLAMTQELKNLAKHAEKLASGDLDHELETDGSRDELGILKTSFEKMRTNLNDMIRNLDSKVMERTIELEEMQKELIETAHRAGMADIATGVLHNIGNILNSVCISNEFLRNNVKKSRVDSLMKANELLEANSSRLGEFFDHDPKGKKLSQYYIELGKAFDEEKKNNIVELDNLDKGLSMIKHVVATQQDYAKQEGYLEDVNLTDIIQDIIKLNSSSFNQREICIKQDLKETPYIKSEKVKLMHVIMNLVKNSMEALEEANPKTKTIRFATFKENNIIFLEITDNGIGMGPDLLDRIFSHGYTTKDQGHGFGLHSCANALTEMGASIQAFSDGIGKGATFQVSFVL
ncbi:MAG: HAMP domain-containing protein [Planctomycetes bacterium]|nr:HAMP domain-containing protein [Planctomycetota bacterium]